MFVTAKTPSASEFCARGGLEFSIELFPGQAVTFCTRTGGPMLSVQNTSIVRLALLRIDANSRAGWFAAVQNPMGLRWLIHRVSRGEEDRQLTVRAEAHALNDLANCQRTMTAF
jgi:hypothetical protein